MLLNNTPAISLLLLFSIFPITAESSDDPFVDMPVVLSADKLEQTPTRTPVSVSVVDRQMIVASGARTIPDALRLIPGIVIGHSVNDFGDKPLLVVSYHGHSDQFSRQMNVLIDGRSIYDPLLGGVNWYNIPVSMDDIERIEVTRGPNASTFGSNSFQAVINIITRHASEDQGHFAKVSAGNHDIFDATYRYGGNEGDLDYRVTLSTVNDDGQDRANGNDAHDDVNSGMIDYRMDYQLNTKNQITYQGGYGRTEQNAEASLRGSIKPERTVDDTNAYQFLRWDRTINSSQSFVVKYFLNYLDEQDDYLTQPIDLSGIDPAIDPLVFPVNASYTSRRNNLEFTHYVNPADNLKLVWGLSGQHDRVDSDYYLNGVGVETRNTYRLFGSAVWDINRFNTIDLGVLIENSDGTETDVSPRIAFLYHPDSRNTFRFGISQAVRTPFIFEQHGHVEYTADVTTGGGMPYATLTDQVWVPEFNLRTEKITSVEIGYYGKFLNDDLMLNTRLFRDRLKDLIDAPEVPDPTGTDNVDGSAFVFENLYETTVTGIEVDLDYYIDRSLRIAASGTVLNIDSGQDPAEGKSREYEESAPQRSASVLVMKDFNELYSGSLGFYYTGDMAWMDANHHNTCTDGYPNINGCGFRNTHDYSRLDLRLARNFSIGNERLSAAIVLQNLLGDYNDYDSVPNGGNSPAVEQNLIAYFELKLSIH
jgi:iron complex outermembrane recepter protein